MSDSHSKDELMEGETRQLSSRHTGSRAADEPDLDALTMELETRMLADEELDDLTAVPIETTVPKAAGGKEASPDGKAKRKAALEKAQALVGKVLSDRYEVEEVLAAGGMGCVYRGRHVHMHKRVAIKVLLPDTEGLPDLVLRFKREAVAGAHIDHPNVAAATDFGKLGDGSFFLVQQYIRGSTLYDVLRGGPLPEGRAARIMRQVALALEACHQIGVVHRDLKPRNIMIEEDRGDAVKLIDFGLAKVPMDRISTIDAGEARKNLKVTTMGTVFGTVGYMAPEAVRGMDEVDERSDLYALGIMLYEMLTGVHPFGPGKAADVLRMHRSMAPPPMRERAPGVIVSPALEAVTMRLLEKDPEARFATAGELIKALEAAVPGLESMTERSPVSAGDGASKAAIVVPPVAAAGGAATPPGYIPRFGPRASTGKTLDWAAIRPWAIRGAIGLGVIVIGVVALVATRGGGEDDKNAVSASSSAPVVSVAPSGARSAEPSAQEDAEKVAAARKLMRSATESKEWGRAAEGLVALVDASPRSFEDKVVASDTIAIAVAIDVGGGEAAERVFGGLANKLGSVGLDLLYEIVSTRGGSKASARAAEILRQKDVRERASAGLRIAMDLRDAGSCKERLALLERARKEGDARAVAVLDNMRHLPCVAKSGECCFKTNGAVADTVTQIWARLRSSQ